MPKLGCYGTYHKMSVEHLARDVKQFSGHHNIRSLDAIRKMSLIAYRMHGKRLRYKDLTADNDSLLGRGRCNHEIANDVY